jgi:hypothetical protein
MVPLSQRQDQTASPDLPWIRIDEKEAALEKRRPLLAALKLGLCAGKWGQNQRALFLAL